MSFSENQFVDTQDVRVEKIGGIGGSKVYKQTLSANPIEVMHAVEMNRLRDNRVEKLFDLTDAKWEIRMILTQPDFASLFTLSIPSSGKLPVESWKITLTSQSGTSVAITGDASLSMLRVLDTGVGVVEIVIQLDFSSGSVARVITVI